MIRSIVVLALALPAIARADSATIAEARAAIDAIRYDEARRLLVEALQRGANGPDELVEIYRLSAATAAVLGPPELAEQYYRRMLALDPTRTIPQDASPKMREPFVAAQAYMAAQQRFDAHAARIADAIEVSIVDPLGMVAAVATLDGGALSGKVAYAGAPVRIADGGDVVLLDEHANFLRIIALPARERPAETPRAPRRPVFERPLTWAIPAAVFAGASVAFFVDARLAKGRLDDILANDSMHFFEDAETERKRWRTSTVIAGVALGVSAACTVTAIVMARRQATVRVTPSVSSDRASLLVIANF